MFVEQVGGKHYKGGNFQHWDLMVKHDVSYLEACATKYLDRWREKEGIKDLQKAISFIQKRLACIAETEKSEAERQLIDDCSHFLAHRQFTVDPINLLDWFESADIGNDERRACTLILCWRTKSDLTTAIAMIAGLIEDTKKTSGAYTNQG